MQINFHISALAVTARFVAIIYLTGPLLNAAPARREIYEPITAPAASSAQTGELTAVLDGGIGSIDVRYPPEGKVEGLHSFSQGIDFTAWRGERVNAQLLLHSNITQSAIISSVGSSSIADRGTFCALHPSRWQTVWGYTR